MNEAGREKLREQVAQSVAAFNALPPLERAIETLRQKRSFVRGLMPMDSPLNDEQINEIINQAPEFVILDALTTALATIEAQGKEIAKLTGLVYVPGAWRCAKCDFTLIQSNLNARDGTITARDDPGNKCPNCNSPLWRVSERDDRKEAQARCNKLFDDLRAAKAKLAEQEKEIERLKANQICLDTRTADELMDDSDKLTAANARIAELERLNTALTENNTQLSRWYEDREKFLVVNGLWDKFQADRESGALWKDVIDLLSEPKKKG